MSWLTCCGCPVITGAAHGIAKATATLFAEAGGRVVLADRDAVAGEQVAELLRGRGFDATFVECDVSQGSCLMGGGCRLATAVDNRMVPCMGKQNHR